MATLFVMETGAFVGDDDAQLVAGDVAAELEQALSSRAFFVFPDVAEAAVVSKQLIVPSQYTGSGLVAIVHGFFKDETVAAETGTIDVFVEAVTPNADTIDMETASGWSTANPGDVVPGGTAGDPVSLSIPLTNDDGLAVGDAFRIGIRRDTDDGDDTATGDFGFYGLELADDR